MARKHHGMVDGTCASPQVKTDDDLLASQATTPPSSALATQAPAKAVDPLKSALSPEERKIKEYANSTARIHGNDIERGSRHVHRHV